MSSSNNSLVLVENSQCKLIKNKTLTIKTTITDNGNLDIILFRFIFKASALKIFKIFFIIKLLKNKSFGFFIIYFLKFMQKKRTKWNLVLFFDYASSFLSKAKSTLIVLPSNSAPSIASLAAIASSTVAYSTKPKPFDFQVSLSFITLANVTSPYSLKASLSYCQSKFHDITPINNLLVSIIYY